MGKPAKHVSLPPEITEPHNSRGSAAAGGALVGAIGGSIVGGPIGAAVGGAIGAMVGIVLERIGQNPDPQDRR